MCRQNSPLTQAAHGTAYYESVARLQVLRSRLWCKDLDQNARQLGRRILAPCHKFDSGSRAISKTRLASKTSPWLAWNLRSVLNHNSHENSHPVKSPQTNLPGLNQMPHLWGIPPKFHTPFRHCSVSTQALIAHQRGKLGSIANKAAMHAPVSCWATPSSCHSKPYSPAHFHKFYTNQSSHLRASNNHNSSPPCLNLGKLTLVEGGFLRDT